MTTFGGMVFEKYLTLSQYTDTILCSRAFESNDYNNCFYSLEYNKFYGINPGTLTISCQEDDVLINANNLPTGVTANISSNTITLSFSRTNIWRNNELPLSFSVTFSKEGYTDTLSTINLVKSDLFLDDVGDVITISNTDKSITHALNEFKITGTATYFLNVVYTTNNSYDLQYQLLNSDEWNSYNSNNLIVSTNNDEYKLVNVHLQNFFGTLLSVNNDVISVASDTSGPSARIAPYVYKNGYNLRSKTVEAKSSEQVV